MGTQPLQSDRPSPRSLRRGRDLGPTGHCAVRLISLPPGPSNMKLFYGMSILHLLMEGIGGIVACIRPEVFEAFPVHAEVARNLPHNMRCLGVCLMVVAALGAVLLVDPHASNA